MFPEVRLRPGLRSGQRLKNVKCRVASQKQLALRANTTVSTEVEYQLRPALFSPESKIVGRASHAKREGAYTGESIMSKIVVIGSSNTDMVIKSQHLPAPGETILGGKFLMNPGGKGANQAVAAAKLGGDVVFVARVGDDLFGREALDGFKKVGMNTDYIVADPLNPSGIATIMVDENGENCISVASGANNALSPDDVDKAEEQIKGASTILMQLETPLATIQHAASMGRRLGKSVILNPAPACELSDELLADIDIITPNESEAELLTGIKVICEETALKAAEALHKRGVNIVIITMGAQGSFILSDEYSGVVPARKVDAVDTTAAGDTFNGALAVGLAKGMSISDAVKFANIAASISVTRMGAQSSTPLLSEVEDITL